MLDLKSSSVCCITDCEDIELDEIGRNLCVVEETDKLGVAKTQYSIKSVIGHNSKKNPKEGVCVHNSS